MNGTGLPSMKRRRLLVGNNDTKYEESVAVEENSRKDTFFPSLPVEFLAVQVSNFLDRPTWNNLSMACCELFQATNNNSCRSTILPPWPYQTRHECDHEVHSIVFAPGDDGDDNDGGGAVDDKLFVGLGNRTIQFLDRRMGWHRLQKTGHLDDITCLAYSPKDRILASSSEDGIIQLWNTTSKRRRSSSNCSKRGCPTSTTVSSIFNDRNGGGDSVRDGESGSSSRDCYLTCIREWSGDFRRLYTLAFSPDGKYLASGGRGSTIQLWNVHDGSHRETLRGHEGCITTLSFSPDGRTLASGSHDMRVRLWHLSNDQHKGDNIQQERDGSISSSSGSTSMATSTSTVLCKQEQWVISVSFSPDGEHIACGHSDCSIKLWDAKTLSCKRIFCGHTGVVSSITFSLDGNKMISSSYDRTIKIWHVSSGTVEKTLEGHTNQIRTVALSRDGRTLASGGWDHSVRLWRI
jgi:WD40 repeat protein